MKKLGKSYSNSIFLEDISSVEVHYKSKIWLLIIGIIIVFAGFIFGTNIHNGEQIIMIGILVGGIFIANWWFSRKHTLTISPNGGRCLDVVFKVGSDENVESFATNLQEAKLKRVNTLSKI